MNKNQVRFVMLSLALVLPFAGVNAACKGGACTLAKNKQNQVSYAEAKANAETK